MNKYVAIIAMNADRIKCSNYKKKESNNLHCQNVEKTLPSHVKLLKVSSTKKSSDRYLKHLG